MLTLSTRHTVHTLLDAVTLRDRDGSQPAVIYIDEGYIPITITRGEFRLSILHYAAAMQQIGIRQGDLVVMAYTQNLESMFAFWGALYLGAIPSMFPTLTEKLDRQIYMTSLAKLVDLSGVRVVLTTDEFAPDLASYVPCQVYGSGELPVPSSFPQETQKPNPKEVAFLQHSSGTTGLQKGVALSHLAALNQIASYSDALQLQPEDVIVSWLPLYHDMGLIAGFMLPLVQGIPLVLMSPFDWVKQPAMLFRAIHDYHGTLCWLPNFAYNHCARRIRNRDLEGLSLASMRAFINCSEPVYDNSHRLFLERFADLGATANMLSVSYAMAENTFAITQTPLGQPAHVDIVDRHSLEQARVAEPIAVDSPAATAKVSCGVPIEGTQIKVTDETGNVLPERHVGELSISSDCMLTGYHKRTDLQPIKDGWYATGDMGYLADGEVFIIGRSKDLIINAGKNVYPQDIEAIVNTVSGVHPGRAVAFGVYDEREGTELIAVIAEIDQQDEAVQQRIWREIKQTIAYQTEVTVTYVHLVDDKWLIKTSSGKIARAANREKWLAQRSHESRNHASG